MHITATSQIQLSSLQRFRNEKIKEREKGEGEEKRKKHGGGKRRVRWEVGIHQMFKSLI